jgi:hypothetical protein
VRGAELDQFTPESIVQMGVGGNRKAWAFFKLKGLGRTSDSGRAIDYNHKHAQAYKQQILDETAIICKKLGCGKFAGSKPAADPVDVAADSANPAKAIFEAKPLLIQPAAPPAGPTAPKTVIVRKADPLAVPTTTVIRKAEPAAPVAQKVEIANGGYPSLSNDADWASVDAISDNVLPAAETEAPAAAPEVVEKPVEKPAAKPAAKPLDFDFDFDF